MAHYSQESAKLPNFKNDVKLVHLARPEAKAATLYQAELETVEARTEYKKASNGDYAHA
ncbi:MAG: hypothetical protein K1X79_02355 [Oligoflexia bacterium]|nr:hypothetical protein [Oligoflexia bacterium]